MLRLNIEIPDDLRAKIEARAAEMGHSTIQEYVEQLIADDAAGIDYGAPPPLRAKSREQLEAMLLEAMQSPAREVTPADWAEKRRRLVERIRQAKAG